MRAVCWCAKHEVQVQNVDEPKILSPRDIILKITSTAVCGSDLHLYDGYIPTMQKGDILGHEPMGEVVEVGSEVTNVAVGDRVVVPFNLACGRCWFCEQQLFSCCDNSNPNAAMLEKLYGSSSSGLLGYSHLYGGYAGGQAEYLRVPFGDVAAVKVPDDLPDEKVLFLSDILPTGYQAAENCGLKGGEVVAVWGCGPVGQMAIKSALMLGASMVIAIDSVGPRLQMAVQHSGAVPIDIDDEYVFDRIAELTAGRGADACIDAVGLEAHGMTIDALYDRIKVAAFMATDRGHALRQAINCCRKGGVVSIPGVYGGLMDKFPIGSAFGKALTFKMGQTHTQRYMRPLLERIRNDELDPSFIISHTLPLEEAPRAYHEFRFNREEWFKVVLKP